MSDGGLYSLATIGAKHVIDAATAMVLKAIDGLSESSFTLMAATMFSRWCQAHHFIGRY
ncbi:MAG: hypothetical protein GY820_16540 [Gammaproteobacteria bacterium]|nr:hypothetical protein [Gammaproteobacteria bacterium]